jgi:predicted nucleotidyltransferase
MNKNYMLSNFTKIISKPVIENTKITAEKILESLKAGKTIREIINLYPSLSESAVKSVIEWELKQILDEVTEALKNLYQNNLVEIILYGSYARQDYDENSDIDLLVVLKEIKSVGQEIDRIVNAIYDINLKYNTLVSVVPISYTDYKKLNSPLLLNVRKEGVQI